MICQAMTRDLLALGLIPGGVVLVHSSLRSLARPPATHVPGGADAVIQGLLTTLTAGGTLLMPALSYENVTAEHPVFDARQTASCVGLVTETFRRRQGVLRSVHPTHSVCGLGPKAAALLNGHEEDRTPCGKHSPFRKLGDLGGQILMLGCGLQANTSVHAIEETIQPDYLFGPDQTYRVTNAQGETCSATYRTHGFAGWLQRYDRISSLLEPPEIRTGTVLGATAHLIDAAAMWRAVLGALQRDRHFLVDRLADK
jgi:aminoglycoside 3-N-acetyltransferase